MSDSDSSSTVPGDSFEDRVKKVMMGEFDSIEDNMRLFLKQEVSRQNQEDIRKYIETKLTKDMEERVYKTLQLEIRERLDQIAKDIVRYKKKVDELATSVQLVSTMPAEIQTLNERIEVIGGWYPYDNSQFFIRKVRDPPCKTHEELLYLRKELDNIDINAVNEKIEEIEREITGVKKKLDSEDAGKTPSWWWFDKNDPNPASQLPAVRKGELKQDLAVLIKDLPLLHM